MKSYEDSDRLVTYIAIGLISLTFVVFLIINLSSGFTNNPKSTDFNFIVEQMFMKTASKSDVENYQKLDPVEKLKRLEVFKSKNPQSVKTAYEIVAYNTSMLVVNNEDIKTVVENANTDVAMKEIVAKSLSMPIFTTLEITPKNVKNITISPQVSITKDGVVVNISDSILPILSASGGIEFEKLNSSSKNKLFNILKEKIIKEMNSKYKKASVSLSFVKTNL